MSGSFEKETASSTAKSLLGALIALGSGFIFMFLGLVSVTASSAAGREDKPARALLSSLRNDLLTYQNGSLSVSKDQKVLKFRRQGQTAYEEVTYKVIPETGEVSRVIGDAGQRVAKVEKLRFESSGNLLRIRWADAGEESKASWALNRWQGKVQP